MRACQSSWFKLWPFLHYDEAKDVSVILSHVRSGPGTKKAEAIKCRPSVCKYCLISSIMIDIVPFVNMCRFVTTQIQKHQESKCHREAVEVVITLSKTTVDIGEQLSLQHARVKEYNRKYFLHILSCIKYLVRQGLALRGDGDERDSIFFQLLKARGNNDIDFMQW